ncbi:MAG: hypothetical protein AVDCRST_MAG68-5615 [uncultured Gemmatimonadetes bacterium]|uniref:Uncharacterized protein n=1 Tax=uncultured Gemmatimonadota bacterium TaxID=203437 RepID=A0A6J4N3F8_9BACT|nr:MAG: hypothetical protein AVDCRST_MAG68-5615 [uncultured Gemmatimonadota bacterium]
MLKNQHLRPSQLVSVSLCERPRPGAIVFVSARAQERLSL